MNKIKKLVTESRGYTVLNTTQAKSIASHYITESLKVELDHFSFGLPEVDDRFNIWRVPLKIGETKIAEIVINAKTSKVDLKKSTRKNIIEARLEESNNKNVKKKVVKKKLIHKKSPLSNTVILGDCITELKKLPKDSVNLVFTSPPYYNAKPEYSEYSTYNEYLELMRRVIKSCSRVLSEGRFFVLNISPVLIRRASRSESSKRIAVPFDFHRLFIEEGFEFIDDIHWVKPDGAGWSFGRGRRFAADRNPLQYKPVPVTEYVLVYRKKTDRLIDWNIRNHHSDEDVNNSKVDDGYETTNLWRINPSRSKHHPATFPVELANKVISYYSFVNDVILDPFGGIGTTAKAAADLDRMFVITEISDTYIQHVKEWMLEYSKIDIDDVEFINTDKPFYGNMKLDFK